MLPLLVRMRHSMDRFKPEEGATAVEYGIMVALIAAVIIGAVLILGGKVNSAFNTVNSKLPN